MTLRTIAEAVGVSRTTVSNAYNRPDQLAPALRDRILGTAHELGYWGPDPAARRLRSGRREAVGLLVSEGLSGALTDPASVMVLQGIARATEDAGVALLLVPERGGVREAVVDAFCLYSLAADHPSVAAARERGVPLVVVDAPRIEGHAFVGSEDRRGARLAVEHLLALGHRRFALLTTSAVHHDRLAGYRDALEAALAANQRPTALIAATDQLALGALEAAGEAGLRVPDEVSVIGFDDIPGAAWSRPALTTVRQPLLEKGEVAGRLLSDGPDGREVILPVQLVVRGSTARAG